MKNLFYVILSVMFPFVLMAQQYKGYDALGLAMYCNEYLRAPKLEAVSTLLNTFGNPMPCIEKRIQQGGLSLVQVDLIDATCWRNKVCPAGVSKPDDLRAIESRAKSIRAYKLKYPSIEFQLSPSLEHDIKDQNKVTAMMAAAKKGCPECSVINSPFSGARNQPLELHGTKVSAYSVSGDGASMFDADNLDSDNNRFNHSKSGSFSTYAWFNELNLRCTGEKTFTPPLKRTNKPTADLFAQSYLIMQPEHAKPTAPSKCKQIIGLQNRELYKPNAEFYCNGSKDDGRGNKPLLIIKKQSPRGTKLNVLNKDNKSVGCFSYYGSYTEKGLHRWYMGNCSKQTPYELYKAFNNEWGFVEMGGGKCLIINSIRRLGYHR